jgi:hypothetical protein
MKTSRNVCDACRKLIRDGEQRRIINGFTLHIDEFCLDLYYEKVKSGILRVQHSKN